MRNLLLSLFLCGIILLGGCSRKAGDILLNVDFEQDKTLTYRFVTSRDVELDLTGEGASKAGKGEQSTTEGLDMVISYTPVATDIYGNTSILAECKSIKAVRQTVTKKSDAKNDPVLSLKGMSWEFVIDSAGVIQDFSNMEATAKKLGEKAITGTGQRRIKDPDLIWDFVATQWFLWDAIASNSSPWTGVNPGDCWKSLLPVPFAVRVPVERYVDYCVDQEQDIEDNLVAIDSTYSLRSYDEKDGQLVFTSKLPQMPKPYEGSFQTRGMFGFLRDYKADTLTGGGKAVYDLSTGTLISDKQEYQMDMTAAFLFPLGNTKPVLKVKQKISVQLLKEEN